MNASNEERKGAEAAFEQLCTEPDKVPSFPTFHPLAHY
jgi:hypothetical protein